MKVNSIVFLQLSKSEIELLNEIYTRTAINILTSELSLQEINDLIEKLSIN